MQLYNKQISNAFLPIWCCGDGLISLRSQTDLSWTIIEILEGLGDCFISWIQWNSSISTTPYWHFSYADYRLAWRDSQIQREVVISEVHLCRVWRRHPSEYNERYFQNVLTRLRWDLFIMGFLLSGLDVKIWSLKMKVLGSISSRRVMDAHYLRVLYCEEMIFQCV